MLAMCVKNTCGVDFGCCSFSTGNAKASRCGTAIVRVPRFFYVYICSVGKYILNNEFLADIIIYIEIITAKNINIIICKLWVVSKK